MKKIPRIDLSKIDPTDRAFFLLRVPRTMSPCGKYTFNVSLEEAEKIIAKLNAQRIGEPYKLDLVA